MSKHLRNLGTGCRFDSIFEWQIVSIFCISKESFEKMKTKKVYAKYLMKLYVFPKKATKKEENSIDEEKRKLKHEFVHSIFVNI